MSRLTEAFSNQAKIAYLTAGDGGVDKSVDYFLALVRGGANVLEVGVPFSDPVADGLVIQSAMERAITSGIQVEHTLNIIRKIRAQSEVAIVIFTYYNPIQSDLLGFLHQAKAAGADGILVVDLPYEESDDLRFFCQQLDLAAIAVAAPSSSLDRIKLLADSGSGFLYYACRRGTTGVSNKLPDDLADRLADIKQHSRLPVAVGFGVANNHMVREIFKIAPGCVVGSYFVNAVSSGVISSLELENLSKEIYS